jgi:4-hydroxy-tetrahydrodipicolinate synthase
MHPLAGVYAAAVTPLKGDYSPDLEAIPALLEFLIKRGCHGILLLGTTGEGPSFSPEERLEIFRAASDYRKMQWGDQAGKPKLLAGTGTPSLTETISLTRSAFNLGYDGVVVVPPYYFRKATDEGLFQYYYNLIQKSVPSDGFLLGYHIPGVAGIGFSIELLAHLKDAFPLQFAGIKDSSHDPDFAFKLGKYFTSDLLVLNGTDSLLKMALENHAGGSITAPANLVSLQLRKIWDTFQRGEDTAALQERLTKIRHLLEKYPPFPPLLKGLLAREHGLPKWPVRPPLENAPAGIVEEVADELFDLNG